MRDRVNAVTVAPLERRVFDVRRLADRGAVLMLGLVAGFLVGLSFDRGGRITSAPQAPVVGSPAAPKADATEASLASAAPRRPDPRVVVRMRRDRVLTIGVFGDSFGNGVWDALYHQLPRDSGFAVLRFSKEATGFTRYHTLDLEQRAREQLAREPIDAAVISFGANDAQAIYADGHLYPLMSNGWQRVIGGRIARFVAAVRATGAIVYWLGLPAMRDPQMDATMLTMDRFYAQRLRRLGVHFVEARNLSVDAAGRYTPYLPDASGTPRLMRTSDGVHMIGIGYQRLTASIAADLRDYDADVRKAAGMSPPSPSPTPTATSLSQQEERP